MEDLVGQGLNWDSANIGRLVVQNVVVQCCTHLVRNPNGQTESCRTPLKYSVPVLRRVALKADCEHSARRSEGRRIPQVRSKAWSLVVNFELGLCRNDVVADSILQVVVWKSCV